jgi:hypothetical protein
MLLFTARHMKRPPNFSDDTGSPIRAEELVPYDSRSTSITGALMNAGLGSYDSVTKALGVGTSYLNSCTSIAGTLNSYDSVTKALGISTSYLDSCTSIAGAPNSYDSVTKALGVGTSYLNSCTSIAGTLNSYDSVTKALGIGSSYANTFASTAGASWSDLVVDQMLVSSFATTDANNTYDFDAATLLGAYVDARRLHSQKRFWRFYESIEENWSLEWLPLDSIGTQLTRSPNGLFLELMGRDGYAPNSAFELALSQRALRRLWEQTIADFRSLESEPCASEFSWVLRQKLADCVKLLVRQSRRVRGLKPNCHGYSTRALIRAFFIRTGTPPPVRDAVTSTRIAQPILIGGSNAPLSRRTHQANRSYALSRHASSEGFDCRAQAHSPSGRVTQLAGRQRGRRHLPCEGRTVRTSRRRSLVYHVRVGRRSRGQQPSLRAPKRELEDVETRQAGPADLAWRSVTKLDSSGHQNHARGIGRGHWCVAVLGESNHERPTFCDGGYGAALGARHEHDSRVLA